MTDILCRWLNEEVNVTTFVDQQNFAKEFATGYLLGEVLYKHGLQDDFQSFSQSATADSKLNNFTRLEPTLKLLEVPYDTNVARAVMNENHGAVTRLMYQLFIALGNKSKRNLTGVAMETMRPSGPVKLESIESGLYKEKIPLQATVHVTKDLLRNTVEELSRAVVLDVVHEIIRDLAVNVVHVLQQLSFSVVKDMKRVLCDVRELGNDRRLKIIVRDLMKEVIMTSKLVMNFVNSVDTIIQLLKQQFRGMDSSSVFAPD